MLDLFVLYFSIDIVLCYFQSLSKGVIGSHNMEKKLREMQKHNLQNIDLTLCCCTLKDLLSHNRTLDLSVRLVLLRDMTWHLLKLNSVTVVFSGAEEQARNRFQSELEFVQCLANPNYLNCE